jgi:hypothetical protein
MKKTNPVKEEQKQLAQNLKQAKLEFKDKQRNHTVTYKDHWNLAKLQSDFRHRHIAYCLIKGRSYEQIEQPKEGNEPDFQTVDRYQVEFKEKLETYYATKENVCSSPTGS